MSEEQIRKQIVSQQIFIPSSPQDMFKYLLDPRPDSPSRRICVQGEDVVVLVYVKTLTEIKEMEIFSSNTPVLEIVKDYNIEHSNSLSEEKARKCSLENTKSVLTNDRHLLLSQNWMDFLASLPQTTRSPFVDPVFFVLDDFSFCYLIFQNIGVCESDLDVELYLRSTIHLSNVEEKYQNYRDTLLPLSQPKGALIQFAVGITVIDPIKITSKTKSNSAGSFIIITLENTCQYDIKISNLMLTCQYALDKPFLQLPCELKGKDMYTFVIPVRIPVFFSTDLATDSKKAKPPSKPLPPPKQVSFNKSPSPMINSERNSMDIKRSSKIFGKFSTKPENKYRFSGETSPFADIPEDRGDKAGKRSSMLCTKLSDQDLVPQSKRRNSISSFQGIGISVGLTLTYAMSGMMGELYVSRELRSEMPKYQSITMRISFPEKIRCHRVFCVIFELIYQCTTEKHLTMSITSVDSIQSPVYCLHPTIDIGVFSNPCTSSISVEFLSNKSGLFPFGPIQLKAVNTGEIFKMSENCQILIEP
ncbi:hypothetical protein EIN_078990 [Entamoeba invadens IP1]|uniref:hypothetical protein n=1 Tax=Entamoeba invadens IP1 TaxID=370355 RepID=UPI0002C3E0AA|nr:hypothetical protein EIN_078990 [Entamoeba invadens IP1]ELP84997.1 hypothetical protein EIN_078990 [Entamoeba invadens IP1]|eukprot:XP_004184343.1 hypothetical protein EIN_078990 [Entamoeba invadens IP1]